MKSLIILPEADAEAISAADWYENQAGLGKDFLAAVTSTIQYSRVDPASHERLRGKIHRIRVSEFPYDVIFEEQEHSVIVIAIAHHHRRPQYWKLRR